MDRVLITGGAGFIGSNFVRHILDKYKIVVLDKLTYAGNLDNLKGIMENIEFIKGDICDKEAVGSAIKDCVAVLNFAAETHVDRSIVDAGSFVETDVFGTYRLLEASRKNDVEKYVQISTDEVYGSTEENSFKESDPLSPSSPYSASKAGGDMLAHSYHVTYGMQVLITRSSNNFGPYQHPEKVIPLFVTNLLQGKKVPLYGDGSNIRDWIYVMDNCSAIELILQKGSPGEIYNAGGGTEIRNIDLTNELLKLLGKDESYIEKVQDRPGHDYRYSLDCTKIKKLGWSPEHDFSQALHETVEWYRANEWWWRPLVAEGRE